MSDRGVVLSSEDNAGRATEELVDEGKNGTACAVAFRALVVGATRIWYERAAELEGTLGLTHYAQARFEKIWRAAYVSVRKDFDEVRAAWASRYETAQKDVAALVKSVAEQDSARAKAKG
ncbi:hypothetical protein [Glutamicibacter endophyticus]|uniref:hypothetical protein n=1 Tax=Glutamicibacter endophyticus TaxID=1522174 RepID=UPI003AEF18D6